MRQIQKNDKKGIAKKDKIGFFTTIYKIATFTKLPLLQKCYLYKITTFAKREFLTA